jgi:peroxiredoxin
MTVPRLLYFDKPKLRNSFGATVRNIFLLVPGRRSTGTMGPFMQPEDQVIGGPVLDFSLPTIGGGASGLSAVLANRTGAVAVFWSGVCSHCVRYDAYLNAFRERHPELGLIVVASRVGETPDQIRKTMAERGIQFPIVHDANSIIARQWASMQTPRAYLVSSDHTLLYRGSIDNFKYPGDPDYTGWLELAISDFLSGTPVRRPETASFGCAVQSVYYTLPKNL